MSEGEDDDEDGTSGELEFIVIYHFGDDFFRICDTFLCKSSCYGGSVCCRYVFGFECFTK